MRAIHITILFVAAALVAALGGCGSSETTTVVDPGVQDTLFAGFTFGDSATFDVVTWNIENFTSEDDADPTERIRHVIAAVEAMDADVIALQEIVSGTAFQRVVDGLSGWDGFRASEYWGSQQLAYLWNTATVTVAADPYHILVSDSNSFPRRPLVLECTFAGTDLILIDNHLKCCGDGYIAADPDADDDGWIEDEETRRLNACLSLEDWIRTEHGDESVILLGDMNDRLTDNTANNVFTVFLEAPDDYVFADMAIAEGPSSGWSYSYSSHFDHILLTDELFAAFASAETEVLTLPLDDYLSTGWNGYESNLSDHLPVGLRLPLAP